MFRSDCYENHKAKKDVQEIIQNFEICNLTKEIIDDSFDSDLKDFEDAIQLYTAHKSDCDVLVTRNKKDFKTSRNINVKILSPEEFLGEFYGKNK